ncbi:3-hydroxyacyl-CoA dehydrogenase [Microlunatus elymi]|uniref:3-hydroxyacyl-CoA dehydrogenase n=1 Tax=Microlunatus elymi TaxID=2596828 RepID=A0A516PZP7_9ACTN|nr:3-hydroxyacyl-CoA dehydrogenase NAD-binding domain-containing protein [Microlunatus elymi]QDP96638.1 3-hydroxyacyl-CoA dehydrogenase [Microlunatus elymi]
MSKDLTTIISEAAALTDDEVITKALSRDVDLPHGAGTAVLITLDNGHDHTRPNTLGPRSLRELNNAIDAALARDDIAAICITGKPFILAAGADLTGVAKLTDADQAEAITRIGHEVYAKLTTASVPTFTFYNGLALGGGLEIGLHCTYRTVSSSAAGLALPECFLGMVPAWGGAYLLPNLIGADNAVTVIIENPLNNNRMLKGPQAHQLGIADAIFDGADFLERSLDWAGQVISGKITVERPEVDRGAAWDEAVARGREIADAKVSGAAPAPYKALELITAAKHQDRLAAFERENQAMRSLLLSDELRSGLYAFDLVQKRARKPAGAPESWLARPVTKIGVVGAGLMAGQLALLFLRRLQLPVVISDVDQERVDRGIAYVHSEIDKLRSKGRINDDTVNRFKALITGTTDYADYADCEFVIEAVFEELAVKKQVFGELEKYVSAETILATNTSSLSVTEMAAELDHPQRVLGFHFFNPVAVLPLLEVARGERTDDETVATALAVAKKLKKNAVIVSDAPAFVVNRLLTRLMGEVIAAIDEGTPIEVADNALRPLGLPMTPMVLTQLVGPAIALHVAETLNAKLGDRFGVSPNLRAWVESGRRGLYDWDENGQPYVPGEVKEMFTVGDNASTPEQILERATSALAEEIGLMLQEKVVAAPMDIDLCLILGAGWPFHDGGITPYLDRTGISEKVLGQRFLPRGIASVAQPS